MAKKKKGTPPKPQPTPQEEEEDQQQAEHEADEEEGGGRSRGKSAPSDKSESESKSQRRGSGSTGGKKKESVSAKMMVEWMHKISQRVKAIEKAKAPSDDSGEATRVGPLGSDEISPVLCATAAANVTTALEGHMKIYKVTKMLANLVCEALEQGRASKRKARHYAAAMKAFATIAVQAAENLGPQPSCGMNAMVRYISSTAMACLEEPATAVYNKTAADAVLATARTDSANRSGGKGRTRGNRVERSERTEPERKRYREDREERDRDNRRRR